MKFLYLLIALVFASPVADFVDSDDIALPQEDYSEEVDLDKRSIEEYEELPELDDAEEQFQDLAKREYYDGAEADDDDQEDGEGDL
jgi:hypothetical protein